MIWRDIPEYESLYEVSDEGIVRSKERLRSFGRATKIYKAQEMKLSIDKDGYFKVNLSKDGKKKRFFVHRLVAIAFIENPHNKPVVNHKDGNKQNNKLNNLEWATNSENDIHAFRNGLRKVNDGGMSKRIVQYSLDGCKIAEYNSLSEASKITGVSLQSISYCCNGKCKTGKGFVWEFK